MSRERERSSRSLQARDRTAVIDEADAAERTIVVNCAVQARAASEAGPATLCAPAARATLGAVGLSVRAATRAVEAIAGGAGIAADAAVGAISRQVDTGFAAHRFIGHRANADAVLAGGVIGAVAVHAAIVLRDALPITLPGVGEANRALTTPIGTALRGAVALIVLAGLS